MRIEQLKYFLEISHLQNISLVADKLYMNQSTLSSNITSLEKELGAPLLRRTSHGVTLTPLGEELLPIAKSIVQQSDLMHLISTDKRYSKIELNISINPSARIPFTKKVLTQLHQNYEINRFQLIENYASSVIDDVITNRACIGISAGTEIAVSAIHEKAKKNDLTFTRLPKEDTLYFICRADHKLAKKDIVSFPSLEAETFAMFKGNHPQKSFSSSNATYKNFKKIFLFSNYESLFFALQEQNMVAIVPQSLARENEYVKNKTLVMLPVSQHHTQLYYYLLAQQDLSPIAQDCFSLIKEIFI